MSDACCGGAPPVGPGPSRLRDVAAIRAAGLAGACLAIGLVAGPVGNTAASRSALLAALLIGGSTFVPSAVRGLLRRRLGVGTLMAVAAVGAVALGELGEAATLAFLFSISEALEGYALARARQELRALLDLVPPQATVLVDGSPQVRLAADLRPGDLLLVRPGERIATDGVICSGRSALDLSAITGEAVPVERGPGDEVYAATVNGRSALEIEVTAAVEDNSLARIVRIVEEAQERKGRSQRLAERIARPLVPGVLVAAAGKAEVVDRLRAGSPIAMVGDGINDAPALATATVGIAMGSMGSDVAIQAADVALMGDDLRHLPETFTHARRAGRVMRQNLLLSATILAVLVPLAAAGVLGLAAVVAIHELAEVVVIANGVRAGRRGAFGLHAEHGEPRADDDQPVLPSVEPGCQEDCCAPSTVVALGRRP